MLIVLILWAMKDWIAWCVGKILSPLIEHPKYELIVVMVVVPVICNAVQYWVTDSFIKKKKQKKQAEAPQKELPPPPIRGNPNESIDLTPYNSTPVNPIEEGKKSDKSLLLDHED